MEWVRLHSESVTGRQGYAAGYKKDIELEMLDPTGVVIEKWILQGTMLNDVDFGSLDYGNSDLVEISATLVRLTIFLAVTVATTPCAILSPWFTTKSS